MKGRVEVFRFAAPSLVGNPLSDSAEREVVAYLPPDYDKTSAKYPVLTFLHGFTGQARGWLHAGPFSPNVPERIDALVDSGAVPPFVAVFPDGWTALGGSQWRNSAAVGRYEDYVVRDVVNEVDRRFRTLARPGGRGLIGKSSGGYGAVYMATLHADVFGHVASHAGDAYFEYCYLPEFPKAAGVLRKAGGVQKYWAEFQQRTKETRMHGDDHAVLNALAMAAVYSPDARCPLGARLPFDIQTARIDEKTWVLWLSQDPVRFVGQRAQQAKALKTVFLDCGTRDEFHLQWGTRMLVESFRQVGVEPLHEEFDDGHSGTTYRYERSVRALAPRLER
ncbi:MAG: alpha/beta hydrolase [Myxococcaceae bacterium]